MILGIYLESLSPIISFEGKQILHLMDNKGVGSVFAIGSPKLELQAIATKVYKVANSLGLRLYIYIFIVVLEKILLCNGLIEVAEAFNKALMTLDPPSSIIK